MLLIAFIGEEVILVLNKLEMSREIVVTWDMLGYDDEYTVSAVRDLWLFENLPNIDSTTRQFEVNVEGHGVVMLKLTPSSVATSTAL